MSDLERSWEAKREGFLKQIAALESALSAAEGRLREIREDAARLIVDHHGFCSCSLCRICRLATEDAKLTKLEVMQIPVPAVGTELLCLVCGYEKPWGIFDSTCGVAVCIECRDKARSTTFPLPAQERILRQDLLISAMKDYINLLSKELDSVDGVMLREEIRRYQDDWEIVATEDAKP